MRSISIAVIGLTTALAIFGGIDPASAKSGKKAHHKSNDAMAVLQKKGCKTELAWMHKAGVSHMLHSKGPITVFAPTEAAYSKLGKARVDELTADPKKLANTMKYHIAHKKIAAADIPEKGAILTSMGEVLMTNVKDGKPTVDGCLFTEWDIPCSNGIIHLIDEVPVPERGK
ncbi:MAG: fasciclin domain-containing protein [Candidatus Obscuribacterales bacterium]|nr:fasciclin domain-containing protein [Candidatus Obscuribacterales bacterium]